ncbi:MAG: UvrD-helicase domain-containing protein, partial [Pseudomonadota bacterium]
MSAVDAAARERALDVTTSFHVQAPAGSGKTELLVQRLLALLATVERPDAILAITFTRKAAGEMAERVADAFGPLRSMPVDELPAHRRLTRALADRVYEHAQTLGWPLPDTVEQLNIMTLDALHRQLAMRAPLTSRLALAAEPVSGPAATEVYRRAALRLLERLPSTGDDVDCLNEVIAHFDHDIEAWLTGMAA